MPIYAGSNEVINFFSGADQVLRAYEGSDLAWEGEVIEGIQRGFSDIGVIAGSATATVTITSVDTAKSVVIYRITSVAVSGAELDVLRVDAVLSAATTISVTNRDANAVDDIGIEYQVVEFK